mgnify:CR=1 FL=1
MTEPADRAPILVIGYGNDLRSDDGAGRWVADRIDAMGLAGVEARSIMQLTPEVSLDIVERRWVVFVDASVETEELRVDEIEPTPGATVMTHHGDPASLLAVSEMVGQPPERATLVSIPARNLEMGNSFSPPAERAARAAVDRIVAHIRSAG